LVVNKAGPWIRSAEPKRTVSGIHRLDFLVLLHQVKSTMVFGFITALLFKGF